MLRLNFGGMAIFFERVDVRYSGHLVNGRAHLAVAEGDVVGLPHLDLKVLLCTSVSRFIIDDNTVVEVGKCVGRVRVDVANDLMEGIALVLIVSVNRTPEVFDLDLLLLSFLGREVLLECPPAPTRTGLDKMFKSSTSRQTSSIQVVVRSVGRS